MNPVSNILGIEEEKRVRKSVYSGPFTVGYCHDSLGNFYCYCKCYIFMEHSVQCKISYTNTSIEVRVNFCWDFILTDRIIHNCDTWKILQIVYFRIILSALKIPKRVRKFNFFSNSSTFFVVRNSILSISITQREEDKKREKDRKSSWTLNKERRT